MTFKPLTKSTPVWMFAKSIGSTDFITVDIDDVRSAVEGLKEYLLKKSEDEHNKSIAYGEGTSSDFWDAKHIATFEAMECVDMWFPVFSEDSHSHGSSENGVHVKELSNSVSGATTKIGCVATVNVANSEGRQQSMATCCRQHSEGSSPSPSSSHSQPTEEFRKASISVTGGSGDARELSRHVRQDRSNEKHAPCKGNQECCTLDEFQTYGCDCECHKDTQNKHYTKTKEDYNGN